jgi:hypothetical protein
MEGGWSFVPVLRRAGAVIAWMLILSACGGDDQANTAVPADFSVTLQRTVCFGACPVYTASVDASGRVQYDGTRCVAVLGHQESHLSQGRLRALMAAFSDIDFFALQDVYRSDEGSCEPGGFDGTVIVTTLRMNGMEKTVRNWHGCNGQDVAARLDAFERRVDDLLGTAQWVPCRTGALGAYPDYSQCSGSPGCQ